MKPTRIIPLALFAAFSGLAFVGVLRFRVVALLAFAWMFLTFANDFRKLRGTDPKSVALQQMVEARHKELPFTVSKEDYAKVQIAGMLACTFLLLLAVLKK